MRGAKAMRLMRDVVVNNVAPHAVRRCAERNLPREALAGHVPGVTAPVSRSGRTLTVYARRNRSDFLPGHFKLGDRSAFPSALFRDERTFGELNDEEGVSFDATGYVQSVVGKRGRNIKRVCAEYGVCARISGGTIRISGLRAEEARAAMERPVVRVELGTFVGRVIGKGGSNVKRIEREFGCTVSIKGTAAWISGHGASSARAAVVAAMCRA
jgi:hypothetical protein